MERTYAPRLNLDLLASAARIKAALEPLLKGELPHMVGRDMIKFG